MAIGDRHSENMPCLALGVLILTEDKNYLVLLRDMFYFWPLIKIKNAFQFFCSRALVRQL